MESKIKLVRRTGFTVLPNQLLRDPTLTLQAKGLFALMMSYPDDWEYSVRGLAADIGCGRDKVRSALQNLEDSGYLLREQVHTESGKFAGNLYVLYDEKISPLPGFPAPENPLPENPTQTKERLTKERLNNPPISPQGGRGRRKAHKDAPDWQPDRFAGFWGFYPPKGRKDKQAAIRAWDKLRPDDALIAAIGRALRMLKASEDWQRGVGIPYAANFLNGERWHDADSLPEVHASSGSEEVYGWQD